MHECDFELESKELVLIASRVGAPDVLGLADPHQNWLGGEIQSSLQRSRLQLLKSDWLRENGAAQLASPLVCLAKCVTRPSTFLRMSLVGPSHDLAVNFYRWETYWARIVQQEQLLKVTLWDSSEPIVAHLREFSVPISTATPALTSFQVSERLLDVTRSSIVRGTPCPPELLRLLGSSGASALTRGLQFPLLNGNLLKAVFKPYETPATTISYLWGPDGLWGLENLEVADEHFVLFKPQSPTQIGQAVTDLAATLA